jgi:hypothetical protein
LTLNPELSREAGNGRADVLAVLKFLVRSVIELEHKVFALVQIDALGSI